MAGEAPADLSGIELSRQFHCECVEPLLQEHLPTLRYASALIGPGSEVLGFDDSTSRDHDWGPRLLLFLEPADCDAHAATIRELLRRSLPETFRGYSTHWEEYSDDPGVSLPAAGQSGDVNHRVTVHTVEEYLVRYLGPHPLLGEHHHHKLWLTIPQQKLRTVAEGAVFRDDVGMLTQARTAAAAYPLRRMPRLLLGCGLWRLTLRRVCRYFPKDVWIYMLHAGYSRLGQLSHFMGRCGSVGDELGSRVIAAQLVHDVMHLCFLLERTYAPYPKWFGTGWSKLRCAPAMETHLKAAMDGNEGWQGRDRALAAVYTLLGKALNDAAVIAEQPSDSHVQQFWGRPFQVPNVAGSGDENWVTTLLAAAIEDPELKEMCDKRPIGAIEQHVDNTDVLENPVLLGKLGDVAYRL